MGKEELKRQIGVMQAFLDGKAIEHRRNGHHGAWFEYINPNTTIVFDWVNVEYRIKQDTPDYIDVAAVHPDYKWMTRDLNGDVFLFKHKPVKHSRVWEGQAYQVRAKSFISLKIGTCSWEDSLLDLDAMRRERGLL